MGTDPHGLVFYGFALVDEEGQAIEPWQDEDEDVSLYCDWEKSWIKKHGGLPPKPSNLDYQSQEWNDWRATYRAMMDACSVKVALAGYGENLINCIVIKESYVRAEWTEILPIKSLETKAEWDKQLQEWCNLLGVEYRQPGWHVACLYF